MARLADWILAHRPLVWLGLALVCLGAGLGGLRLEFDGNVQNLFRGDDERMRDFDAISARFGTDEFDVLVLVGPTDVFTPATAQAVRAIETALTAQPAVRAVVSAASVPMFIGGRPAPLLPEGDDPAVFAAARASSLAHPLGAGGLLSADGRYTMVVATLEDDIDAMRFFQTTDDPLRTALRALAAEHDVPITCAGLPIVRGDVLGTMIREQSKFFVLAALAGGLVAFGLFRRILPTLLGSVAAVTGALWATGAIGALGIALNPLNGVVPIIVLVVGYTDAVHLIHALRNRRAAGDTAANAVRQAVASVGPACALTSLTTAIGFGSLMTARLDVMRTLGLTAAVGAILCFVAVLTIIALLASYEPVYARLGTPRTDGRFSGQFVPNLVRRLLVRPRLGAAGAVALTAAVAFVALRVEPSAWLREGLPTNGSTWAAVDVVDEHFGGALRGVVLVEWPAERTLADPEVERVVAAAEAIVGPGPVSGRTFSVLDLLDALPPAGAPRAGKVGLLRFVPPAMLGRIFDAGGNATLIVTPMPDIGLHATRATIHERRAALEALEADHPGFTLTMSGAPIAIGLGVDQMIGDLLRSLLIAGGIIFIIMTIAFRSLTLGVISVLPNALPLLVATASLTVTGQYLTLNAVVCLCVCLGIAVDDTIHVCMRAARAARHGATVPNAVVTAVAETGPALITTTLVLGVGFGTIMFSVMPMLVDFGALTVTALGAALVGDLVMLPWLLVALRRPRRSKTV